MPLAWNEIRHRIRAPKPTPDLDRAVDRCYREEPFPSDRARFEYLFQLLRKTHGTIAAISI